MTPEQTSRRAHLPAEVFPSIASCIAAGAERIHPLQETIQFFHCLRRTFLGTCTKGLYPSFVHQSDTVSLFDFALSIPSIQVPGVKVISVPTILTLTNMFMFRKDPLSMG